LKHNFEHYLKTAKYLSEKESIPDYEKYFEAGSFKDSLLGSLDNVLFVIDLRESKFIYLSPNTMDVEGYEKDYLMKLGPMNYFNLVHEIDSEIIINKIFDDGMSYVKDNKSKFNFSKMKISYNYRLRQKNNNHKMLMQQFSYMMIDEDVNPLIIMGTVSDITELYDKNELFCRISILNSKNKWEKVYERFYPIDVQNSYNLSAKEIEILRFVSLGKSSKEIANVTNKSIETVNSQRKSILNKTNCKSLTEVVVLAKLNKWI
jgi:DNA-binding CsgD family transcriptional regulator